MLKISLSSIKLQFFAALSLLMMAPFAVANAQTPAPTPAAEEEPELVEFDTAQQRRIAVPVFVAPSPANTPAGNSANLGRQVAQVIAADLRASGLFEPIGPSGLRAISLAEVTAPQYGYWKSRKAEQLIEGFVRVNGDGNLTVGCYLYDITFGGEITRLGFVVSPREWRRAAHKCADSIYSQACTGEKPFFRQPYRLYCREQAPRVIAASDDWRSWTVTGRTTGSLQMVRSTALTPRFSPDYKSSIVYLSYSGRQSAYLCL